MSHWEVVWVCFGLTAGVLVFDFWQAQRAARQLRERLLLQVDDPTVASGSQGR